MESASEPNSAAPRTGSKAALAKFFAKSKSKAATPSAAKPKAETADSSGWIEDTPEDRAQAAKFAEEARVRQAMKEAGKRYLLAVWRKVLTQAKNRYSGAVALLSEPVTTKFAVEIPSEWEDAAFPAPNGYRSTVEFTRTFRILKLTRKSDGSELLHLTIPDETTSPQIHFTSGSDHTYFSPTDFTLLAKGGRRTRRSLPKQKRTRRVIRRLVRA